MALTTRQPQKFLDERTTGMAESQVNFANTTLLAAPVALPPMDEQTEVGTRVAATQHRITQEEGSLSKLQDLKRGLLDDLLTGRVRVPLPPGADS